MERGETVISRLIKSIQLNMKIVRDIVIVVLICLPIYYVLGRFGVTCPIKAVTGVSCAGCGMTRAYTALIKGNFREAFMYHPLFIMPPVVLVWILIKDALNKRVYYAGIILMIIVFLAAYVYRLIMPGDIVTFRPMDGAIYRMYMTFH